MSFIVGPSCVQGVSSVDLHSHMSITQQQWNENVLLSDTVCQTASPIQAGLHNVIRNVP